MFLVEIKDEGVPGGMIVLQASAGREDTALADCRDELARQLVDSGSPELAENVRWMGLASFKHYLNCLQFTIHVSYTDGISKVDVEDI